MLSFSHKRPFRGFIWQTKKMHFDFRWKILIRVSMIPARTHELVQVASINLRKMALCVLLLETLRKRFQFAESHKNKKSRAI